MMIDLMCLMCKNRPTRGTDRGETNVGSENGRGHGSITLGYGLNISDTSWMGEYPNADDLHEGCSGPVQDFGRVANGHPIGQVL